MTVQFHMYMIIMMLWTMYCILYIHILIKMFMYIVQWKSIYLSRYLFTMLYIMIIMLYIEIVIKMCTMHMHYINAYIQKLISMQIFNYLSRRFYVPSTIYVHISINYVRLYISHYQSRCFIFKYQSICLLFMCT